MTATATACSCATWADPCVATTQADVVFLGRVTGIDPGSYEPPNRRPSMARFEVTEILQGAVPKDVALLDGGGVYSAVRTLLRVRVRTYLALPLGTNPSWTGPSMSDCVSEGGRRAEWDRTCVQNLKAQISATAPERVPTMKTWAPSMAGSIGPSSTSNCGPLTLATWQAADVATIVAAIPTNAVSPVRRTEAIDVSPRQGFTSMKTS